MDLVGADREPVATTIAFAGSVKWRDTHPFDAHDFAALARDAAYVPGVDVATPLVAVSRSGFTPDLALAARWTPEDIVAAWA